MEVAGDAAQGSLLATVIFPAVLALALGLPSASAIRESTRIEGDFKPRSIWLM